MKNIDELVTDIEGALRLAGTMQISIDALSNVANYSEFLVRATVRDLENYRTRNGKIRRSPAVGWMNLPHPITCAKCGTPDTDVYRPHDYKAEDYYCQSCGKKKEMLQGLKGEEDRRPSRFQIFGRENLGKTQKHPRQRRYSTQDDTRGWLDLYGRRISLKYNENGNLVYRD